MIMIPICVIGARGMFKTEEGREEDNKNMRKNKRWRRCLETMTSITLIGNVNIRSWTMLMMTTMMIMMMTK